MLLAGKSWAQELLCALKRDQHIQIACTFLTKSNQWLVLRGVVPSVQGVHVWEFYNYDSLRPPMASLGHFVTSALREVAPAILSDGGPRRGPTVGSFVSCYPLCYPLTIPGLLTKSQLIDFIGAPERIRTSDPQIRSLVLYPAELRARLAQSRREIVPPHGGRAATD